MKRIAFAVVLGLFAVGLFVGTGTTGGTKKAPRGTLPSGWKSLNLSKSQVAEIYTVQSKYRSKIDELEMQIENLRLEERREMVQVLTQAQKDQLVMMLFGETGTGSKKKDSKSPPKNSD